MRKGFLLSLVLVSGFFGSVDAQACGDKFLVAGRGLRYQRVQVAAHPSSILIYMNPASHMVAAAKDINLESGLKQAGHKVKTVADAAQLETALTSATYDLILADIVDSPALKAQVGFQASRPVVVPVLYHPTPTELTAAEKQYGCAMKSPSKDYLSAIDEALNQKLKGGTGRTFKN